VDSTLLGYCGLYCGGCSAYQETEAGTTSQEGPEAVTCRGCASDELPPWCADCAIKRCNRQRGIRYCLQCSDYPCEQLMGFTNDPKYPYHKAVHADMERLDDIGLAAWLEEQASRWICGDCGNTYHWFAQQCPSCGARVNLEYWPD